MPTTHTNFINVNVEMISDDLGNVLLVQFAKILLLHTSSAYASAFLLFISQSIKINVRPTAIIAIMHKDSIKRLAQLALGAILINTEFALFVREDGDGIQIVRSNQVFVILEATRRHTALNLVLHVWQHSPNGYQLFKWIRLAQVVYQTVQPSADHLDISPAVRNCSDSVFHGALRFFKLINGSEHAEQGVDVFPVSADDWRLFLWLRVLY